MKMKYIALALVLGSILGVSCSSEPDVLVVRPHTHTYSTYRKPARCASLEGEVGQATSCSIYEQRSSVCREFEASWSQGVQNVDCDAARAAFGLAPLEAPHFELDLPISA